VIEIAGLDRVRLAALIGDTLAREGIDVVLTGGSCVSIYTSEHFVSLDLDFIDVGFSPKRRITKAICSLGFTPSKRNSRYFEHPDTKLTVEFPTGPLMIGDEKIEDGAVAKIETDVGVLRLLTPTDCVKDRLANYYYFKDRQCYEQALLVARKHPIDWGSLQQWHENERQSEGYEPFRTEVER
jgi:hypothetical protein